MISSEVFSEQTVILEGKEISIPRIQGNPNVFVSPIFFFSKPKWLPDDSCTGCFSCQLNFTTLRRKHHCRHCGRIFCGKCCIHRVPLPQFALDEPQRVCNACRDVAELVARARSQFISHRQEAATGLVEMLKNTEGIHKMVSCGGMQTLLSLASQGDLVIWGAVASGNHLLAQHFSFHPALLETGTIHIISHFMNSVQGSTDQLLVDCLTTLSLFCSNKLCINKVIELTDLGSVEKLLLSHSKTIYLLAANVLHRLVQHVDAHNLIMQRSCSLLSSLLKSLRKDDIQMQVMVLRILNCLSTGSENIRHQIILEDDGTTGSFLRPFLSLRPASEDLLENALCLLANLASAKNSTDQSYLQSYISPALELLKDSEQLTTDTLSHLSRGLSNFAEFSVHSLVLVNNLSLILSTLMRSNCDSIRLHACRLVVSLITTESTVTFETLAKCGVEDFLHTVFSVPGISDVVMSTFMKHLSRLSTGAH